MSAAESKREREKQVVQLMIRLYCKKLHGTQKGLCPECRELAEYSVMRSARCPFMETKAFCSNCRVHCYKPEMREKIRKVMRFSGPRMLLHHPVMAVRHVMESRRGKRTGGTDMKLKRLFWIALGCMGVGLGAVGAVLPMIPAFPFLLLAAFSFARSSERLHSWFINTRLYKNNLESYVKGRGMTCETKLRVILTVTALMSIGFTMMYLKGLYIPCAVLGGVWIFHIIYFIFGVKTCRPEASESRPPLDDAA